ncbi:MAG TPA: tetratricopeptide repeat protein, partial [Longimicrobiales bacterium]|nr:tetratricopeptide repeat protein [Longimicrobiales bacterium]
MARSPRDGGSRYALRFAGAIVFVMAVTLLLVFYVFPERYVLDSGFRESGQNLPDPVSPFDLDPVRQVTARPLPVPRPEPEDPEPEPGPGELLWRDVLPLIGQKRYDAAAARLRTYLADYPGDRTARSELAVVLLRADRPDEAVAELRRLVQGSDDVERRLQLARTLRELGRTEDAAAEFRVVIGSRPEEPAYWLDLARTYAWAERYREAADVLASALERHPNAVPLRVEMARTRFAMDDLAAASRQLAGISDESLAEADGLALRDAVVAAMTVPEPPPPPPPTLFERAVQAREDDEFVRSGELFRQALDDQPDDAEIWEALANLREYELEDFEGARSALLEVERIREADTSRAQTALELRIARLESWLGRNADARARLSALLSGAAVDPMDRATAHATLGDIARWEGDRPTSADQYALALAADASNEQALDGIEALHVAVDRTIRAEERPGISSLNYLAADTDDFLRVDVGGQWVRVRDDWAFGGAAGRRLVDGLGLLGDPADARQGFFADVEAARWWRYGTLRTSVELGLQDVADEFDYSVALAVGHRGADGNRTDLRYEHGPAYLTTATLQSLVAGVVQDVVRVTLSRSLGEAWHIAADASVSSLRADLDTITGARNERTIRLDLATTLSRRL